MVLPVPAPGVTGQLGDEAADRVPSEAAAAAVQGGCAITRKGWAGGGR